MQERISQHIGKKFLVFFSCLKHFRYVCKFIIKIAIVRKLWFFWIPAQTIYVFIYFTTILLQAVAWLVQFCRVTSSFQNTGRVN